MIVYSFHSEFYNETLVKERKKFTEETNFARKHSLRQCNFSVKKRVVQKLEKEKDTENRD